MKAALTTNIVGGLGNQLFLVANLLATSQRTGIPAFLHHCPWSGSCEAPRPTYWNSIFERLHEFGVSSEAPLSQLRGAEREVVSIPETRPATSIKHLDASRDCVYDMVGFFQSEAFFGDYPIIKQAIPARLVRQARHHLCSNYSPASDEHAMMTVALHARRGDYTRMTDVFEQLDVTYYDTALRQLYGRELLARPHSSAAVRVLVFCEEERYGLHLVGHLKCKYGGLDAVLVHPRNETACPFQPDATHPREVLELLMMGQCDDVVMANSSYSWWGAYLNARPMHRVVVPSKWFVQHPYPLSNHLYCDEWILL